MSVLAVRYGECWGERPLAIYAFILLSVFSATLSMSFVFPVPFNKAENDTGKKIAASTYDVDPTKVWKPFLVSISESFTQFKIVVVVGAALAVGFSVPCFVSPIIPAAVFVGSNALLAVAFTQWYEYKHQMSTLFFSWFMSVSQIAVCVVFIRKQNAHYVTLLSGQLLLCSVFAAHPFFVSLARRSPSSSRPTIAAVVRQTLAVVEVANAVWYVATLVTVTG